MGVNGGRFLASGSSHHSVEKAQSLFISHGPQASFRGLGLRGLWRNWAGRGSVRDFFYEIPSFSEAREYTKQAVKGLGKPFHQENYLGYSPTVTFSCEFKPRKMLMPNQKENLHLVGSLVQLLYKKSHSHVKDRSDLGISEPRDQTAADSSGVHPWSRTTVP